LLSQSVRFQPFPDSYGEEAETVAVVTVDKHVVTPFALQRWSLHGSSCEPWEI
jgi:hypothetical protein